LLDADQIHPGRLDVVPTEEALSAVEIAAHDLVAQFGRAPIAAGDNLIEQGMSIIGAPVSERFAAASSNYPSWIGHRSHLLHDKMTR
jgi:hypothetical protein